MIQRVSPAYGVVGSEILRSQRAGIFYNICTVPNPDAYMIKQRNQRLAGWDGRDPMWIVGDGQPECLYVPYGLLKSLHDAGVPVVDNLPKPVVIYKDHLEKDGIKLDALQERACSLLLGVRMGAVELSVSSGKSEVLANLTSCILDSYPDDDGLIVICEPSLILFKQQLSVMRKYINQVGELGGGKSIGLKSRVIVASVQTLVKRPELIGNIRWLLVDECHHANTPTYRDVLLRMGVSSSIWGVSGKLSFTRKMIDQQVRIQSIWGEPLMKGDNRIRKVPVVIKLHKLNCPALPSLRYGSIDEPEPIPAVWQESEGGPRVAGVWVGPNSAGNRSRVPGKSVGGTQGFFVKMMGGTWRSVSPPSHLSLRFTPDDIGVVEHGPRNRWAVDLVRRVSEKWLISVLRTRHLNNILGLFTEEERSRIGVLSGSFTGDEQAAVRDSINHDKIIGIVAIYSCVAEGVNIPNLRHLVKLDGIKAEGLLEQQVGRLERASSGKEFGTLHLPDDIHHKTIEARRKQCIKYYKTRPHTTVDESST